MLSTSRMQSISGFIDGTHATWSLDYSFQHVDAQPLHAVVVWNLPAMNLSSLDRKRIVTLSRIVLDIFLCRKRLLSVLFSLIVFHKTRILSFEFEFSHALCEVHLHHLEESLR